MLCVTMFVMAALFQFFSHDPQLWWHRRRILDFYFEMSFFDWTSMQQWNRLPAHSSTRLILLESNRDLKIELQNIV